MVKGESAELRILKMNLFLLRLLSMICHDYYHFIKMHISFTHTPQ